MVTVVTKISNIRQLDRLVNTLGKRTDKYSQTTELSSQRIELLCQQQLRPLRPKEVRQALKGSRTRPSPDRIDAFIRTQRSSPDKRPHILRTGLSAWKGNGLDHFAEFSCSLKYSRSLKYLR